MKEPRPVLLAPGGRRRVSSSTGGGGLTLPLVSPFRGEGGGSASVSASVFSQRLRSLALPLAAASGVVLLLFCLFASSTTTTRVSSSSSSASERAAALSSSLPGNGNEAAPASAAAARRFRLPCGGASLSSAAAAAAALRGSNSQPSSPPLQLPLPLPTLSPEDEAAFEADLVSMLAGEGGEEKREGGEEKKKKKSGGGGATTKTTAASSSSSSAAAAASDSTNGAAKEGISSSSSFSSSAAAGLPVVVGKKKSKRGKSSKLSSLRLFSDSSSNASSSSAPQNSTSLLPLPPDFDWKLYLAYNPDLRAAGVSPNPAAAAAHFLARGQQEGRPASRLRVALRYTACTGLINQHYSHVAALSLASVLGAEVVLPPAAQRDSFAHYFSTFADRNEVSWTAAPLETLLDVQGLIRIWSQRRPGLTLRLPPSTAPFPDLTKPGTAYPSYAGSPKDPSTVAKVNDVYLRSLDMGALVEKVRAAAIGKAIVLRRAQQMKAANGNNSAVPPLPLITVDLPCTFFMLRTSDSLDVVTGVARTLKFAPLLVELAEKVSRGVAQAAAAEAAAAEAVARVEGLLDSSASTSSSGSDSGSQVFIRATTSLPDAEKTTAPTAATLPFNGVHLRIESDARDWEEILGGRAALWAGYLSAARAAGFDAAAPLYVASGLLTYGASAEMEKVAAEIRGEGLASSIHYKEQHLTAADLASLTSEQKAAVDFLVLARSKSFVGLGSSTFSFYLREHRALEGIPRNSTVLVDASKIGTDDLFASAGVVV